MTVTEKLFLYSFLFMMTVQLLATFIYLTGLSQMRLAMRKAFRPPRGPR
jgi:hypothetical protein